MAPETFVVAFDTTKGRFTVEVKRQWAPNGADRFHELVTSGFYDEVAFFRVLEGFVAQFGISGDPEAGARWSENTIEDDPVVQSNRKGTMVFAMAGPNTRTTQLFINLVDNVGLDDMSFSPFAMVTEGMAVVDSLYSGYGEGAPRGQGPDQGKLRSRGNEYLKTKFPSLDYVRQARVVV